MLPPVYRNHCRARQTQPVAGQPSNTEVHAGSPWGPLSLITSLEPRFMLPLSETRSQRPVCFMWPFESLRGRSAPCAPVLSNNALPTGYMFELRLTKIKMQSSTPPMHSQAEIHVAAILDTICANHLYLCPRFYWITLHWAAPFSGGNNGVCVCVKPGRKRRGPKIRERRNWRRESSLVRLSTSAWVSCLPGPG